MAEVRILSIIPPMTQLNTPYPSTAYLTGFLRSRGFKAEQADLSIALALKLLSVQGVRAIYEHVNSLPRTQHTLSTAFFAEHFEAYRTTITPAIRFLQGRDPSLEALPSRGPALFVARAVHRRPATGRRRARLGFRRIGTAGSRQTHCHPLSQ
jgi:hypothetical protein